MQGTLPHYSSSGVFKSQIAPSQTLGRPNMSLAEHWEAIEPYLFKWYTAAVVAAVVLYIANWVHIRRFKQRHGCGELFTYADCGPFAIPMLFRLLRVKASGMMLDYIKTIFDTVDKYTFDLYLMGVPVVCTVDPENIKAVLATQFTDFALGVRHAHFKPLLGDGIFTLDGEGWKSSRSMLRPQFAREQVSHVQSLEPHLQKLAAHIDSYRGATINIQDYFFRLTVDTATEFLFGESVDSLDDSSTANFDGKAGFAEAFNTSQAYLSTRSYTQMMYFLVNNKEFRESNERVHKFASHYVRQALETPQEELDKKSKGGYIFLYELVKQTREPKVLQDQLLNILLAGRDTTAGMLSFTFFELARNPEVFAKLKEEIYTHFGLGDESRISEITFESLKKCEYLKFVLNEVLRMYPSVPVNFRVSTKETTLPRGGGVDGTKPIRVGKGTTVAYSVYATHRLPEFYGKDSDVFRPERWADLKRLGWAYVPFNGGPRICLGQQFALTEVSYVVTRLIQLFPNLVNRDDAEYPPKKSAQLTMCHQNGVFISMTS